MTEYTYLHWVYPVMLAALNRSLPPYDADVPTR